MTEREAPFPARVGKGHKVHLAHPAWSGSMRETTCGFFGEAEWITRCDLEPITCKTCLTAHAMNSHSVPVSACLVTRGDLDLTEILQAILAAGIDDLRIWNNALEQDEGVYGRYRSVEQARHPIVYTQDDDCVVPSATIRALIEAHRPGEIVANMPQAFRAYYPDSCLLGFGAVFERDLPAAAFERYRAYRRRALRPTDLTIRPDVVFTALTPYQVLDLPYENLAAATGPDRMYRQPGHWRERERVLRAARRVRAAA